MRTSKTAIFHEKGKPFTLTDVPIPEPGEGQTLVRNDYTTLCRSDLNTYSGKRIEKTPTILGHEIVGRIEAFGPDSPEVDCRGEALREGDRVTWSIYASDPESARSRAGIPQKGEDLFKYGHERVTPENHLHGGLSEYCLLRKNTAIIRLKGPIPNRVAALINCSIATVSGAMRLAGRVKGKTVLVTGAGMLGVVACAMCRTAGASRIIAVDIEDGRLETARIFGAQETHVTRKPGPDLKDIPGLEGISHCFDFSGVPGMMEQSIETLDIGGTAIWIGATFPQRDLKINAERLVRNVQVIKGLHNYNQDDLVNAVAFVENHYTDYPFEDLVPDAFNLESVNQAFDYAIASNVHRVGIDLKCHEQ